MKYNEIVVVEGMHDLERLKRIYPEMDILITNGSEIEENLPTIIEASKKRDIILFLDPDYPGERIRKIIQQHILDEDHPAEIKLEYESIDNRVHDIDGLNLIVYSDAVDSGVLNLQHDNLNDVANPSNPNAYKYPYFNKGVWNLSYFRNAIITPVTDAELNALVAKYGQDTVNKLKKAYKAIDRNGVPVYRSSDMRSLIYGKYIAVRFIFKTAKRVKFDNLEFNLQKY